MIYINRDDKTANLIAKYWDKKLTNKSWFRFTNSSDKSTQLNIYDIIGWPFVDAAQFVTELNNITSDEIAVSINSPGGDVFDGLAIYNALRNHPAKINITIDGLAGSIASIIAMSGDDIKIAPSGFFMVHEPRTIVMGDRGQLRKAADVLDKITNALADVYADNTDIGLAEIKNLMTNETWYAGQEAVDAGFVGGVSEDASTVDAKTDLSMYVNAPGSINKLKAAIDIENLKPKDLEFILRDAGISRSKATGIVAKGYAGVNQSYSGVDNRTIFNNTLTNLSGESDMKIEDVTLEYLRANAPKLVEALHDEGKAKVNVPELEKAAVELERKRIEAVQSQLIPGHETLIDALVKDGKTTGEQAAVQILQALKKDQQNVLADIKADSKDISGVSASVDNGGAGEVKLKVENAKPLKDVCKAKWDADPALRDEFGDVYDRYEAFVVADEAGLVKLRSTYAS